MRILVQTVGGHFEREVVLGEGALEALVERYDFDPAELDETLPNGPEDPEQAGRFRRMLAEIVGQVAAGDFVRTTRGSFLAVGAIAEVELASDTDTPF